MTPEELKEIEERYSMSLKTFSLNNLARLGVEARGEILDLLAYIKELQHEIEILSASPDETSSHCGTFLEEREELK